MSILSWLFKGSIRKTMTRMGSETNVMQMAIGIKLSSSYKAKYGDDRGLTITAAVTNKLFAKVSPTHSQEDLNLAERLAAEVFKTDSEVRYASLMACRARLLIEAERKSQEQWFIWDTIQWMATLHELPNDQASPLLINNLANALQNKYFDNKS